MNPEPALNDVQRKAMDEWNDNQDHANDILPEDKGKVFGTAVNLPRVRIVKSGPLHLHKPHDIGTPHWQEEKN